MNSRKLVWQQTAVVAVGQLLCVGLMYGLFALLHKFDTSVLLGGIAGGFLAIANFFLMAVGAMIAADKAEKGDVKGGNATVKRSMAGRFLFLAVFLIIFAKSGYFHLIALVVPCILTRPILSLWSFFRKSGED